jgi:diphosphomevalonate decarboxylase
MTSRVTARAYANIALCKYWGKLKAEGNLPATPSISLALDVLRTDTKVSRIDGNSDQFQIDKKPADESTRKRLALYLNLWRDRKLIDGYFSVESQNHFPTASGLASSASGFAALTMALSDFARQKLSKMDLSRLARRGSGSAARSIPGGLARLPVGSDPAATQIIPASKIPWGMVVAIVESAQKEISSREGMRLSNQNSPYYKAWLTQAKQDYSNMLDAIKRMDFGRIGSLCEANTLAMHACMIATRPSLLYWTKTTVEIIRIVDEWREDGLDIYFTIDAGPHVLLLCKPDDLESITAEVKRINGVAQAIAGRPAGGAKIIEKS